MKIKLQVGIYGQPTRLNLSAKILYGKNEQYEKKVFRKEFYLDSGGSVIIPMDYFTEYAKDYFAECGKDYFSELEKSNDLDN